MKQLAIDADDVILANWVEGINATYIDGFKSLRQHPVDHPVSFRGMTGRKIVEACEKQGRDYYYVDTGYLGNREKRKIYHRVVKNGMQHSKVIWDLPEDRWNNIRLMSYKYNLRFPGWKKNGKAILVVTPSEKPCKFYGIDRDNWVKETVEKIKQYTDRPIVIRDKASRPERIVKTIYDDLNNCHSLVTYQSIAAVESVLYGVPAFTLAPTAADVVCDQDLSLLENPTMQEEEKIYKWACHLAYGQFHTEELKSGKAYRMLLNEKS